MIWTFFLSKLTKCKIVWQVQKPKQQFNQKFIMSILWSSNIINCEWYTYRSKFMSVLYSFYIINYAMTYKSNLLFS